MDLTIKTENKYEDYVAFQKLTGKMLANKLFTLAIKGSKQLLGLSSCRAATDFIDGADAETPRYRYCRWSPLSVPRFAPAIQQMERSSVETSKLALPSEAHP